MYGNRRNLGYKYFSWNCDRAYLSKNKIEDVKQIATRHKPHFIGISEVNLSRNELVPDDNENNNEFSTEQAHEKLKIEGYKLFLPTSWTEHNKARLIVYVDENISVKFQHNPSHSSHIQNILLEVGFGQAKKHFVSFYYREWKSCVNGLNSKDAQIEYFNALIVKLHSDLRILTQLQLVGVGVDFVFPLEVGRRRKK